MLRALLADFADLQKRLLQAVGPAFFRLGQFVSIFFANEQNVLFEPAQITHPGLEFERLNLDIREIDQRHAHFAVHAVQGPATEAHLEKDGERQDQKPQDGRAPKAT